MKKIFAPLCVSALLFSSAGFAHSHSAHETTPAAHTDQAQHQTTEASVKLGDLTLDHAHSQATTPNARVAGGYLEITNHGKTDDYLIGGTTDAAKKVEIHEMSMKDNIMKMRKLTEPLLIPAGHTIKLAPSGFHIMFMELNQPFKQGETVEVELEFKESGKIKLPFHVNPMSGSAGHCDEHSQH